MKKKIATISVVVLLVLFFAGYKYLRMRTLTKEKETTTIPTIANNNGQFNQPKTEEQNYKAASKTVQVNEVLPSKLRLHSSDAATGYSVLIDNVIIRNKENNKIAIKYSKSNIDDKGFILIPLKDGKYEISVEAKGYDNMTAEFAFYNDSLDVDFNLVSTIPHSELKPENVQKLHQDNAMIIVGFVVDNVSGNPIKEVNIFTKDNIVNTTTNSKGFFQLAIPLPSNDKEVSERNTILFSKQGYITEVVEKFDMYPRGDIGLKIRLGSGLGENTRAIITHRDVDITIIK
jgi:hypothetical protein